MSWVRALVVIGAGLGLLRWLVPAAPLTGDGQFYIEFVRDGLQGGASSWHERRLLGPLMVHALPVNPQQGFLWLTLASLAVAALLTWLAAARQVVAIPLFLGTWAVAPNIREYGLVDPLAWAFVAGIWLALVRQHWLAATIVAAVGVLAKEVVLLAALAAAAAAWDRARPWRAPLVAAPALLVVLTLTVVFPGSGTDAGAYLAKWVRDGLGSLGPARVVYLVFASFGALWLLVPHGISLLPAHQQRAGAILLLAAPLLPFVGSPERMEEVIFPIIVASAVAATGASPVWLAWVIALCNLLFVARVGGDARLPTVVAWGGLLVACALAVWTYMPERLSAQVRQRWLLARPTGTTARSP